LIIRNIPAILAAQKFPVIASPLFIISNPKLVIEQCKAGVIGWRTKTATVAMVENSSRIYLNVCFEKY
jgi:NAD(P)H-dependent flavin oxidoreductase YrpB (nitropropane dioxygenase family)